MRLAPEVRDLITAFNARDPHPRSSVGEEYAQWTHRLCEQLAFSFPATGWGHKSAGPGRPHSTDVIATRVPFLGWDILINAGDPRATLYLDGDSLDLTGQVFEPVTPVNHLGESVQETADLELRVSMLEAQMVRVQAAMRSV